MKIISFIATVIFVTAADEMPSFRERCMELLNSDGSYAYCNVTTDTSLKVDMDRLNKLYDVSDDLADVFKNMCMEDAYHKVTIELNFDSQCIYTFNMCDIL